MTALVQTRPAARTAGIGYVAIFFLAIFANFFVREGLIVPDDAAETVANIVDSDGLFRAGMVAFLAVFIIDVVVAWGLYAVFRPVHHDLSLLSAWFRLVYTVFLGAALVFFLMAIEVIGGADYFGAFDGAQQDALAMLFLDAFNFTWLVGLAAFGFHLVLMGYLVLKAGVAHRVLGYLLFAAGTAYVVDTIANMLMANYQDHADLFLALVAVPSIVGEMWLGLWLLLRAGRTGTTDA